MRNSGVLLATHDVVYLKIAAQGNSEILNILMTGAGAGSTDFDLYARCGALPTASVYDHRSASGDSHEFISTTQNCSSTWYLAVQSYSGSGMFSLVASYMTEEQDRYLVRVGTDFNATQEQLDDFEDALLLAARRFYGVTEGQVLMRGIYLYNSNGCGSTSCDGNPCDICFQNQPGSGWGRCIFVQGALPDVKIYQGYWTDYKGITHELGHYYFCLSDEYGPGGTDRCGHSIMSNPWATVQNNVCVDFDHETDKTPLFGSTGVVDSWERAEYLNLTTLGKVLVTAYSSGPTPDNLDASGLDFNGLIVVTQP